MATVACPGCGLPRAETEVGATPCPVCASAPMPATGMPSAKQKASPDPTAGLPADASELNAPGARASAKRPSGGRSPLLFVGTVTFLLGTLFGAGCVLGFRAINWPQLNKDEPEVATKPEEEPAPTGGSRPPLARTEVAPMPHEPAVKPLVFGPELPDEPEPEVKQVKIPLPGHLETHDFNDPKDTHSVPVLKRGEHVVLRGKVNSLRLHGLDAGATLDASKLEAATIIVTGKIDGRSTLKLNAPNGVVQISGKIDGRSIVEITAPGGEVKFMLPTTPTREGSKIDNGSTVSVTGRIVEFKGDITGIDTKVSVVLTRSALLKVASVSGKAAVEYKSQAAGWSPPEVTVGFVSPTATFRKVD